MSACLASCSRRMLSVRLSAKVAGHWLARAVARILSRRRICSQVSLASGFDGPGQRNWTMRDRTIVSSCLASTATIDSIRQQFYDSEGFMSSRPVRFAHHGCVTRVVAGWELQRYCPSSTREELAQLLVRLSQYLSLVPRNYAECKMRLGRSYGDGSAPKSMSYVPATKMGFPIVSCRD
jgi:hypothetical protein